MSISNFFKKITATGRSYSGYKINKYNIYSYELRLREEYCDIVNYLDILNIYARKTPIKIAGNIYCFKDFSFGCSTEDIIKYHGRPSAFLKNVNDIVDNILAYRLKVSDYRIKCEFHFSKGRLFYFNKTFSHLAQSEKPFLLDIIKDKYLDDQEADLNTHKLVDGFGGEIVVTSNIVFSIDYIGMREAATYTILKILEEGGGMQKKRGNNHLNDIADYI